jgi:phosphoribosylcarboxyaminoimidazole (NCAIR) mutase
VSEQPRSPETGILASVEELFREVEVEQPQVGIIMGSESDKLAMQPAGQVLEECGVRYEVRVMSAHREPEVVSDYCGSARMRGLRAIIAGAGMSAALPGVAAAHTDLLSAVQMPPGVPVACVAINGARNAGILATRMLNN